MGIENQERCQDILHDRELPSFILLMLHDLGLPWQVCASRTNMFKIPNILPKDGSGDTIRQNQAKTLVLVGRELS